MTNAALNQPTPDAGTQPTGGRSIHAARARRRLLWVATLNLVLPVTLLFTHNDMLSHPLVTFGVPAGVAAHVAAARHGERLLNELPASAPQAAAKAVTSRVMWMLLPADVLLYATVTFGVLSVAPLAL